MVRSLRSRMTSAHSLATVVALGHGDADVGLAQRGRVVDAVAEEADGVPGRRSARTSRAFCAGSTRANTVPACAAAASAASSSRAMSAPVSDRAGVDARHRGRSGRPPADGRR